MCPDDDEQATTAEEDRTVPDRPGSRAVHQRRSPVERYRLLEPLGRGGMGEVIAARDENIGREVAIKRMTSPEPSGTAVMRFLREARIQGRLDHPAIAPVYELAHDREDRPFFVMKRLRGVTLKEILEREREKYPRQRLLRALVEVCLAVELAHTRGVIHRDLKPSNIMLGDFGEVYVLDWGVAKVTGDTDGDSIGGGTRSGDTTHEGAVIGTPGYMAPEQLLGQEIDHRVDVYALGCMLFELLAGSSLHGSGRRSLDEVDARPSVRAPDADIPPELDELCVAATQRDPDERIATARELGDAIQAFLDGDRDLERRRTLAREHLGRATAALAQPGDDARSVAMREAGRAIALDPTLTAAADIVSRLMLEPPAVTPAEVERELAADTVEGNVRYARVALLGYFGYLVFLPEILWVGVRDSRYIIAFVAFLAANMLTSWIGMVRGLAIRKRLVLVVLGNALMIATVARMFSPLVLGPGIAAATVMAMVPNPVVRTAKVAALCTVVLIVAVLAPWVAEFAGFVPRTMWTVDDVLHVQSPALAMRAGAVQIGLAFYSVALIAFAALMAWTAARGERAAKRKLHLQAWQLRQLVA